MAVNGACWPAASLGHGLADGRGPVDRGEHRPSTPAGDGRGAAGGASRLPLVENPDDAISWHPMSFQQDPQKHRSRRIDIWPEADLIKADAAF